MARYIMLYKGEATDVADMSEEQGNAVMAKWGAWMERIGPALSDVGAPFGPSGSLVDDGSTGQATGLTGYSIVEAEDLGAAQALADGHPIPQRRRRQLRDRPLRVDAGSLRGVNPRHQSREAHHAVTTAWMSEAARPTRH